MMAEARRRWVWFEISPVFTDFPPKNVSSVPSNLRKK
jgi:hypothetical protein